MSKLALPRFAWHSLDWRHNGHDGVSNHQRLDCLLNHLFSCRSKKTSKLHVTGLCKGNSPVTGEFPAQKASNAKNVSIWWRHNAQKDNSTITIVYDMYKCGKCDDIFFCWYLAYYLKLITTRNDEWPFCFMHQYNTHGVGWILLAFIFGLSSPEALLDVEWCFHLCIL